YCPPVAESTTALAREAITMTKKYSETELGVPVLYGDSVTGDTPILLKTNDEISVKRIDEIVTEYNQYTNGKEEHTLMENIFVWSEKGWTRINRVIRHKTDKKLFRVCTHTGVVDVSEDHSLLSSKGEMISPNEVDIGTELLHSFPSEYNEIDCKISEDLAWIWGLFAADGSCGRYETAWGIKYSWAINNTNFTVLNRAQAILNENYYNISPPTRGRTILKTTFKVLDTIDSSGVYKLVPKGAISTMVKLFRPLFYDSHNYKQVPSIILNAPEKIKRVFFEGFYAGDGDQGYNTRFSVKGKSFAMGLYYLARSLGYAVSVNFRSDKPEIYRITCTENYQRKNPDSIKKIWELGYFDDYVYDLTTENHHFHAGVGQMIVHNTDSLFLKAPTAEQIEDIQQWSIDNLKIDLGIDYIFRFVALSSRKKNYFGITTQSRPIVKGMLGKKRNTPSLIKVEFAKMIDSFREVANDQEFENAKDQSMTLVRELLSRIDDKNFTLEDIAVTTIISQRTNKYKSWVQPLQAVMQLEIDDKYDVPEIGAAVTYVKTHPFEITIPNNAKLHPSIMETIKKCSVKPIEFATMKDVDIKKLKDLTESTFSQIMESLGIEWFRVEGFSSIEDFF
ncbi:MAG: DNA polymerase domain-containing protein, partial [Candidatus Kariarchaeaceae archaeon]